MGNTCRGDNLQQIQIDRLQFKGLQYPNYVKKNTFTNRFKQEIQKLKISEDNKYRLILPVQDERNQTKSIQCKILFSQADMQLSEEYQFEIQDIKKFPIIDVFEPYNEYGNQQIYHKIVNSRKYQKTMKYYNFRSFNDYQFKKALYELYLYRLLDTKSPLEDWFIIYKGEVKQLVMIFKYYISSLNEIIQFRRSTNYPWQENQILLIMKMLTENYVDLHRVGIIHRDIRPSTIFFKPNYNSSEHFSRFYQFGNLQSARIRDIHHENHDANGIDDDSDLLTLKGVPAFTSQKIRNPLIQGQNTMIYNPIQIDIEGLKFTLFAMLNLSPSNIQVEREHTLKRKKKILQLLDIFDRNRINLTIEQLDFQLAKLIEKTDRIDRQKLFDKDLTIFQNIQLNLFFNSPQNRQMVEQVYIRTLCQLQKKDIFVPLMLEKLQKNYEEKKKQANIPLFIRVGKYFEDSGFIQNEYYREAIKLLIQLAQDQRISGFFVDHFRYVQQAQQLFRKFSPDNRMNFLTRCLLLKQKAYIILFSGNSLSISQTIRQTSENWGKKTQISKNINQSILLGQKSNLPFQQQMSLLYSKGQLLLHLNSLEEAEPIFDKGLQIINTNYRQFKTKHNHNKYKGLFQLGLARIQLNQIKNQILQRKAKFIIKIEEKLNRAQQRFGMVTIHPVYVINCYVALAELNEMKEDYSQACKMYQKAINLLHAQNQELENLNRGRAISAAIELQIVDKYLRALQIQGKDRTEFNKYVKLHQLLRNEAGLNRKSQRQFSKIGNQRSSLRQTSIPSSSQLLISRTNPMNVPQSSSNLQVIREEQQMVHDSRGPQGMNESNVMIRQSQSSQRDEEE